MKRYVGYVEEIDWDANMCKVRIPNIDGLQEISRIDPAMAILVQKKTQTADLEEADIPFHMQGLRIGDIVYCLDSEEENDTYTLVGFYGGTADK